MHLAVALAASLLLVAVIFAWVRFKRPRPSTSSVIAERIRDEIAFLRDTWLPSDRSFSPEQRDSFRAILAAAARADSVTLGQFALTVSRAVALSGNGHTAVLDLGPHFSRLPLMPYWFEDGLYVIRCAAAHRRLIGARIERFGALPAEEVFGRVRPFISGTEPRVRALAGEYLRLGELLQHIGVSTTATEVEITAQLRNGASEVFRVRAAHSLPPHRDGFWSQPWRALTATPRDVPGRWIEVLDDVPQVPRAYAQPVDLSAEWLSSTVLYVRSNRITPRFLPTSIGIIQREIVAKRPHTVVVDLRLNNGGDFTYALVFAQALPRLICGEQHIVVLVGSGTFSAALMTAALLKQHGAHRVSLVGQPMGDSNPFWAEGSPTRLPFSQVTLLAATQMHDWEHGCTDGDRRYWVNGAFGGVACSLLPTITAPLTFADYATGRDRALEVALTPRSDPQWWHEH